MNGPYSFISGEFKLGLYFASRTREEYDSLPDLTNWGYLTICLPWVVGLVRISFHASDVVHWRSLTLTEGLVRIGGYLLLFIGWPLFSPLM